ncbi:MAG: hypothetical protein K9W43_05300 [Candidatus Thorarchaeota archaeon]|nr:hypothetical protein [Candidatus Thorarchaeota archaeon]
MKKKRYSLSLWVTLALVESIVMSLLLLHLECHPFPGDGVPEGIPGLLSVPFVSSMVILLFILMITAFATLVVYLQICLHHSLGISLVIDQVGIDSPEFPRIYRWAYSGPFQNAYGTRALSVLSILSSILTPVIVVFYDGYTFSEFFSMMVFINILWSVTYGIVISEYMINYSRTKIDSMSDEELRRDAASFQEKDRTRALRWIRSQVRMKGITIPKDPTLEQQVLEIWYNGYLFRNVDPIDGYTPIILALAKSTQNRLINALVLFGLTLSIIWFINSLLIVFLPIPAPAPRIF